MATVLTCGTCEYPITFRDIAPKVVGEFEKVVSCPKCGSIYTILVRMTNGPELHEDQIEHLKNRPTA